MRQCCINDIHMFCVYWVASCLSGGFSPPPPPDRHPHPVNTVGLPKDCLPFGQFWPNLANFDQSTTTIFLTARLVAPEEQRALCEKITTTSVGYKGAQQTQCCFNVGSPSPASAQHLNNIGSAPRVCWDTFFKRSNHLSFRVQISLIKNI